jgi:ABC-type glutathione transport system ATPase component
MSLGLRTPPAVLDVGSLSVSYATRHGRLRALQDVGFSIKTGETLALVGESGSGKSTVSLAIIGLLGPEATIHSGDMLFNGQGSWRLTPRSGRRSAAIASASCSPGPVYLVEPGAAIGLQVADRSSSIAACRRRQRSTGRRRTGRSGSCRIRASSFVPIRIN